MKLLDGRWTWFILAAGAVLPGVIEAFLEYVITGGVSGWMSVLTAFSGGLITFAVLWVIEQRRRRTMRPVDEPSEDKRVGGSAADKSPANPKIFSRRTAAELAALTKDVTEVEAERASEVHLGHWMKVTGVVKDIYMADFERKKIVIYLLDEAQTSIFLDFDASAWGAQIEAFPVGEPVTALGQIKAIRNEYVSLDNCSL